MVAKRVSWLVALLLAMPAVSWGLGLGEIRLNSALNQALDAEIELLNAAPDELAGLKAQLATRDTFARYGLEYPAFLGSVQLAKGKSSNGRDVLKVRSIETITEPFVSLLVEVNWGRGRLVREYTVLLDPPVFTPNAPAVVTAPPSTGSATTGQIVRPTTPEPAPATAGGDDSYTVRRGDTLSAIASQVGNGASREQTMLSLYRANPEAFDGNMNELRAGAILRIPSTDNATAISSASAAAEIQRQYSAWRGRSAGAGAGGEGRLRLVAPSETGGSETGGATAADVQGLRDRLAQVEGELAESKRLLQLKNAELADLQRRLGAAGSAGALPSTPPTAEALPAEQPPATPPLASEQQPVATPPAEAGQPVTPPVAQEPSAAAQVPAAATVTEQPMRTRIRPEDTASSGPGILDSIFGALRDFWYVPLALLALVGGLLGFRKWQASRVEEVIEPRYAQTEMQMPPPSARREATAEPQGGGFQIGSPPEPSLVVEESGQHLSPSTTQENPRLAPRGTQDPSLTGTFSGDTGVNLDQNDPLAEADFHMAYGLYDQAADLVKTAITKDPMRAEYKLKLIEVFFVWGNKDEFLRLAKELRDSGIARSGGNWEKIVIMGRQIAPEEPMFNDTGVSGVTAEGVDLDLAAGDGRVDFDVVGGNTASNLAPNGSVDLNLDLPSLGGDDDRASGLDHTASVVNLDDLPAVGSDKSGNTTAQMMPFANEVAETQIDLSMGIGDAPTVEQPALQGNPTIREKLDAAKRYGREEVSIESTAEVAIDDLGLDIGNVDGLDSQNIGDVETSSDAPTLVAGLDETSRRMIDEAARSRDSSATATLAALDGAAGGAADDVDFELSDRTVERPNIKASNGSVEFDVGSATGFHMAPNVDTVVDDLTLPPLEPVTMSEVGTKLDLARAYIDMGDPDGARNILQEVLQEGSVMQKQEAQRLIDTLPG